MPKIILYYQIGKHVLAILRQIPAVAEVLAKVPLEDILHVLDQLLTTDAKLQHLVVKMEAPRVAAAMTGPRREKRYRLSVEKPTAQSRA
jgi:hypothetical protein